MSSLKEEIAHALSCFDDPPVSEADTCQSVIVPLMWAAGYDRRDIRAQVRDNAGQYPDYTVLPDSPHTWFLEAKAWGVDLRVEHAIQALNYANSRGRWWVVLTNARVWRLYDNRIQGLPEERLVIEARLGDPSLEGFMMAIGKQSVVTGALEKHALRTRMSTVLLQQLVDPDSRVTRALRTVLRSECGLPGIQGSEVAAFFRDTLLPGSDEPPSPAHEEAAAGLPPAPSDQQIPLDEL